MHGQRRQQGRILRDTALVPLLLHRDREVLLVRRRRQRVGTRNLAAPLLVLEKMDPAFQRRKLMGIDRDEVSRLVREPFVRSEEHTSELQSHLNLVCRLLLEKKKTQNRPTSKRIRLPTALT